MSTKEFAAETAAVVAINIAAGAVYGMYRTLRDRRAARKIEQNLATS